MPEQKENLLRRWFEEVWNKARLEAVDEMAAPDIVAHGLVDAQGKEIAGTEGFKVFWHQFRDAFPDVWIDVEDEMADGDKVIVRCTVRGTHLGGGMGLKATGKKMAFSGVCIGRIKDGRLAEAWNYFDFLGLYQQLGVVPASFA